MSEWKKLQLAELKKVMSGLCKISPEGTYLLIEGSEHAKSLGYKERFYVSTPCIVTENRNSDRPWVEITVKSQQHGYSFPKNEEKKVDGISLSCNPAWSLPVKRIGRTLKRLKKTGEYNFAKLHQTVMAFETEVKAALDAEAKRLTDAEVGAEAIEATLTHAGIQHERVKDWVDRQTTKVEATVGLYTFIFVASSTGFVRIAGQSIPDFPATNSAIVAKAYAELLRCCEAEAGAGA